MLRVLGVLAACALMGTQLTGCASFSREDFTAAEAERAALSRGSDIRFNADDPNAGVAFTVRTRAQLDQSGAQQRDLLAISGGGADGAYGAGVMVGWTRTGTRPNFAVVTGVSTGALIAPFAFLGPSWDDELTAAYAGGKASDILQRRGLGVLFSSSLFSPNRLRQLVEAYVTPTMLREVAVEHAKGRRLLIVTTNLDTQQTVIWDMGAIATRQTPEALALFRDVLVASSSIPGVFPPVMIPLDETGRNPIREMHVDGAVTAPFVSIPEGMFFWQAPDGREVKSQVHVIVNGQVDPAFAVTRGRISAVLARTFDSMMKSTARTHIAATRAFAERNDLDFKITMVPDDAESGSLNFDAASMKRLFTLGRDNVVKGVAWRKLD
ncbi:MAG: patatin-like phospholipase family protein [Phenylobacterium sp.]|uniref:patatin-like phospholipase family protein n=1 Tax=Phenylobacterium sp. TaxID=1871053 RepID=UPI00271C43C1|nr:patatin-like phospholipase family protein [Phenylobacterium sp.]MDO9433201.1 patatin-like phospholipase family protein [Phenylobacterium sp.]